MSPLAASPAPRLNHAGDVGARLAGAEVFGLFLRYEPDQSLRRR